MRRRKRRSQGGIKENKFKMINRKNRQKFQLHDSVSICPNPASSSQFFNFLAKNSPCNSSPPSAAPFPSGQLPCSPRQSIRIRSIPRQFILFTFCFIICLSILNLPVALARPPSDSGIPEVAAPEDVLIQIPLGRIRGFRQVRRITS
jgi:hypothetical protein